MRSVEVALALSLAWITAGAEVAAAQGFSAPSGGDASSSRMAPYPPPPTIPASPAPYPAPAMAPQGRPGFATQPTASAPQTAGRQNYADELTDFGVPPQSELQANVGTSTPTSIPGAHVITTAEMRQAVGSQILFIDVLAAPPHPSLPGAVMLPGAGDGGSFDDPLQQKLWAALSQATQMNPDRPLAFFCAGSRCWESYNAALRAVQMGFKMVLWYRGGLASWQAAGLPLGNGGGAAGSAEPPRQRPGFGNAPG